MQKSFEQVVEVVWELSPDDLERLEKWLEKRKSEQSAGKSSESEIYRERMRWLKDNTLCFEPVEEAGESESEATPAPEEETEIFGETNSAVGDGLTVDLLGNLDYDAPEIIADENELDKILDADAPVRVKDRRVIPVEDVDAIWSFRELDLNSRVLNFLAQKKIPRAFF